MVQGMAELIQRSDRSGETANYPVTTSPFSDNSRKKTASQMSPTASADISHDDSVSVDSCSIKSSSSEGDRQSDRTDRPVCNNDESDEIKSSISTPTEPTFVPHNVVIPRTVPCIVLTPPVASNPGLPLAHGISTGKSLPENSHIMSPFIENQFLYGSGRHNSIFAGFRSDNEKTLNLTLERKDRNTGGDCKDAVPKKLAFGIDRILSEETEDTGLNCKSIHTNLMKLPTKYCFVPNALYPDISISYRESSK